MSYMSEDKIASIVDRVVSRLQTGERSAPETQTRAGTGKARTRKSTVGQCRHLSLGAGVHRRAHRRKTGAGPLASRAGNGADEGIIGFGSGAYDSNGAYDSLQQ